MYEYTIYDNDCNCDKKHFIFRSWTNNKQRNSNKKRKQLFQQLWVFRNYSMFFL